MLLPGQPWRVAQEMIEESLGIGSFATTFLDSLILGSIRVSRVLLGVPPNLVRRTPEIARVDAPQ
jgi:hypothetical protein